jgi:hypothetical protein
MRRNGGMPKLSHIFLGPYAIYHAKCPTFWRFWQSMCLCVYVCGPAQFGQTIFSSSIYGYGTAQTGFWPSNTSLNTVHNTQYTVHSTQFTVHSTQYTVRSGCDTSLTVHSTQHTVHSAQCTAHSTILLLLQTQSWQ